MPRPASREVKRLRLLIGILAGIVVGTIHALLSHATEVATRQTVVERPWMPLQQGRMPDMLDAGRAHGAPIDEAGRHAAWP